MHLLQSFSSIKFHNHSFVNVGNLRSDDSDTLFLLDTGATVSLIGLNTICDEDEIKQKVLVEILYDHIEKNKINPARNQFKTATQEEVSVFPCVKRNVTIMGTRPISFYFHIYMGNVHLPLLGNDYLDDCKYLHDIGKSIEVLAVSDNVGKRYYPSSVIDFSIVLSDYSHAI